MNERGLRYQIVTSNATIFVTLVAAILLWIAAGEVQNLAMWSGLGATVLMVYALFELNNRYSLLRIRSRLVSSTFLWLTCAATFLHPFSASYIPEMCLAAAYLVLFDCYQNRHSQGSMFHVFLFIGIGSLVLPHMLCLVPFVLFSAAVQMRAMTGRVLAAALLGVIFPHLLREAYLIITGSRTMLYDFCRQLATFSRPDYTAIDEHRLVTFAVVAVMVIIAVSHYARKRFDDKIRTRMYYNTLFIQETAVAALMLVRPCDFDALFRLFVLNGSPVIAHQLAFARGRSGTVYFYAAAVAAGLLAFYNLTDINLNVWGILRNI